MKKYLFLLKPASFIFNLLFATWLVLHIEKIRPSDFGEYKSLFDPPTVSTPDKTKSKKYLKQIFFDYKAGKLDSIELELKLDKYLTPPAVASLKYTTDRMKPANIYFTINTKRTGERHPGDIITKHGYIKSFPNE